MICCLMCCVRPGWLMGLFHGANPVFLFGGVRAYRGAGMRLSEMIMFFVACLLTGTGSFLFFLTVWESGLRARRKVSLRIGGILLCAVGMLVFCRVWHVTPWVAFLMSWLILPAMMTGGVLTVERRHRVTCKLVELSEPTVSHEETGEPLPSDGGELTQLHMRS